MTQKVLKVGTSAAVTIPKESLKELGLKVGDSVDVRVDKKGKAFIVEVKQFARDSEIENWTRKFISRYRPALEALAKK